MSDIRLFNLTKRYGGADIIKDCSFVFASGGAYCIMGPSGCGKTTLLRLMAGVEAPDAGRTEGAGRVAMVFQKDLLIPHLSALENCALVGCERARAKELLCALGLGGELDKRASKLSGGMARRAALARALGAPGETLLLDEPFTGLDSGSLERAAACIQAETKGRTLICVTHREPEAEILGARILKFDRGRLK